MNLRPIVLPANQPPDRFYDGGSRISNFRNVPVSPAHTPEDWIGSMTSVRGKSPVGMTILPDGRLLAEAIMQDPVDWLGADHVERFGADSKLLVKLLDAGQRLPVHAHPDGLFAQTFLEAAHGKAEAWYILTQGTVYLGLRNEIAADRLQTLVELQNADELLSILNPIRVEAHDTVYVPPGTLHAIGAGILLVEVQEPADLSILLEWNGFELDGTTEGHLDLGFALALTAVDHGALDAARLTTLVSRHVQDGAALTPASSPYFRLDRVSTPRTFPAGFAVVIGLTGLVTLTTSAGPIDVGQGSTILVPAAAGALSFTGGGSLLLARPPLV